MSAPRLSEAWVGRCTPSPHLCVPLPMATVWDPDQGLQGLLTHLPTPSHLPIERSHGFKSSPTLLGLQPSATADTFSTKSHPLPWFTMPSRCGPSGPTNLLPG